MDQNNPVVKLCVSGMQAEGAGDLESARVNFAEAWTTASDDFERCIAAHYVARHQSTPEETLRWNEIALRYADKVGDESVSGFYPSLLLNLGHSHETLNNREEARRYYKLADAKAQEMPNDRYGKIVRQGAESGRNRTN